jgi:AmmeMemoRadiSam system protein A
MLTAAEKHELLAVARKAIEGALDDPVRPSGKTWPVGDVPPGSRLAQPGGAFVTLTLGGHLRGCIGYVESSDPLVRTVASVAVKSAFEDPRFTPLTATEYGTVRVEISVLTPPAPVADPSLIEVGRHGLIVELGRSRGLLLPQVAVEYGWDTAEFLAHTSRKAGLPADGWRRPGARILAFTAEVFGEADYHGIA